MQKQEIRQATADRIRHLRKQRDMRQEELTLRAEINTVYYERREKCTTMDTLYKIAVGLEVPPPNLLRFDSPPSASEDMDAYMEQLIIKSANK